jgi:hypothetical protein
VEILGGMRVPYWHGHALQTLGALVGLQGRHDEASAHLGEAARELQQMGDLNCWAGSMRRKASMDAARGQTEAAREALVAAIEALPLLPMPEVHTPRSLDTAAEVLLAAGLEPEAAYALGRAMAMDIPVPLLIPREPLHESLARQLAQRLDADGYAVHVAQGEHADTDEAVARVTGWLRG